MRTTARCIASPAVAAIDHRPNALVTRYRFAADNGYSRRLALGGWSRSRWGRGCCPFSVLGCFQHVWAIRRFLTMIDHVVWMVGVAEWPVRCQWVGYSRLLRTST